MKAKSKLFYKLLLATIGVFIPVFLFVGNMVYAEFTASRARDIMETNERKCGDADLKKMIYDNQVKQLTEFKSISRFMGQIEGYMKSHE